MSPEFLPTYDQRFAIDGKARRGAINRFVVVATANGSYVSGYCDGQGLILSPLCRDRAEAMTLLDNLVMHGTLDGPSR